jgi:hypothetical protein
MKIVKKLAAIAALAVFVFASCQNPVEVTTPGYDLKQKASSFTGGGSPPASYYPTITGTLNVTAGFEQKHLTLTFPDTIGLDILNIQNDGPNTFTKFETELKKILQFYPLTEIASDNYDASPWGTALSYKVVRREYKVVTVELDNITTSTPDRIEAFIDASAYTYRKGNKVDKDGNGVPGEGGTSGQGYDNFYSLLSITGATGAAAGKKYLGHTVGSFGLIFTWTEDLPSVSPGTNSGGMNSTSASYLLQLTGASTKFLNIAYSSNVGDDYDYKDSIAKMIKVQEYDRAQKKYVDLAVGTITRTLAGTTPNFTHTYRIPLTSSLKSEQVLRVLVNNDGKLTTNASYSGFKQRYYLDSDPDVKVAQKMTATVKDEAFNQLGTMFWVAADSKIYSEANGKNAVIVLQLDDAKVGNQGVIDLPATKAELNRLFKIRYDADAYVAIESAELAFSDYTKPSASTSFNTSAKDQIRLKLDPAFDVRRSGSYAIFVGKSFGDGAGKDWGFKGDSPAATVDQGVFGDFASLDYIDGYCGYLNYGSITTINGPSGGGTFESPAPDELRGTWYTNNSSSGQIVNFADNCYLFYNASVSQTYNNLFSQIAWAGASWTSGEAVTFNYDTWAGTTSVPAQSAVAGTYYELNGSSYFYFPDLYAMGKTGFVAVGNYIYGDAEYHPAVYLGSAVMATDTNNYEPYSIRQDYNTYLTFRDSSYFHR